MIGEYDNSGNIINEYVYFGLRPVAVKAGSNLNIVHSDYLGTPRLVTNGGSVVWQWKNDNPYGNNQAQGSIEFNLRFAGQYYDYESGLHYNIQRTYNPEVGRYMQSDPIGLAGGSNTYNYVNRNPLDSVDPLGLEWWSVSGTTDKRFTIASKNQASLPGGKLIPEGYLVLTMHAGYFDKAAGFLHIDYDGGYIMEPNSELFELVKNTNKFKQLKTEEGKYNLSGETLGQLLKESTSFNGNLKGIILYACEGGKTTNPKTNNFNAQEIADIMGVPVFGPDGYIRVNFKTNQIESFFYMQGFEWDATKYRFFNGFYPRSRK